MAPIIRPEQDEVFVNGVRQSVTPVNRDVTIEVNSKDLRAKAQAALAANATYIAIAAPTVAQNTAQTKALTRQVNALIRMTLNLLDDVTGT